MWCFISEPNGIIHEIFLPKNAVGQDCLDKVRNYNSAILQFNVQWIFPRHLYDGRITRFPCFVWYLFDGFSTLAGLRKAKASRERLFWFEIRWRERSTILVEFEKFYVVAAHWEAAISTVFLGQILRQTTRTPARNHTVSETGEMLMYILHCVKCTCRILLKYYTHFARMVLSCLYFTNRRFHFHLYLSINIFPFQAPVLSYFKELYKRREVWFVVSSNENRRSTMRSGCSYRVWRF